MIAIQGIYRNTSMPNVEAFKRDLEHLINIHSLENLSNTPDFILAEYLTTCLLTYGLTIGKRDKWFRYDPFAQDTAADNIHETPTTASANDDVKWSIDVEIMPVISQEAEGENGT